MSKRITVTQAWSGDTDCLNCAIRNSALFSGLTEEDFKFIHNPVEQITMKPGEVLYEMGETGHHLFTVRSGIIKLVQYLPDGTQRIVRLLTSTDVLGLETLVSDHYEHEAVVVRKAELCRYPKEAVNEVSMRNPQLHKDLMVRWKKALHDADGWLTHLSTGSAKKRLASLLLHLVDRNTNEVVLFSREDLGSILSVTVETASRMVSEFKRDNLIRELRYNHYAINLPALDELRAE